jgi:hypothetical protein
VVSIHFCFGLARHTGHGTDKIRFCVSCPVSMVIVFIAARFGDGQFCSFSDRLPNGHYEKMLV